MSWKHNDLANDLAAHLRANTDRMVWTDMQLGPAASPRPDVFTLPKSYAKFQPMVYEIKVSVADFRRDVTAGKWHSYRDFACGIVFATPKGLISKDDLPKGCGLMTRNDEGWHTVKAPTLSPIDSLPHEAWMKLLIDGAGRLGKENRHRFFMENVAQKKIGEKYGAGVALLLANRDNRIGALNEEVARHERDLKVARDMQAREKQDQAERLAKDGREIDQEREALCAALGLKPRSSVWEITRALRDVREHLSADDEVGRVRDQLAQARRSLQFAIEALESESPLTKVGEATA